MRINFISSLVNQQQRGGAYLRCKAIRRLYELLGFELQTFYQQDISTSSSWATWCKSLRYAPRAKIMFNEAVLKMPPADYLHLDNLRQFHWHFPQHGETPIIYNAHNLEFENYYDRSDSFYARQFMHYECRQMQRAKIILLCSEREKNILLKLRPELREKIFIVPNLVDRADYKISRHKNIIAFIGTLDYYPNTQAIHYLCTEFLQKIPPSLVAKYRFIIAGRSPLPGQSEMIQRAGFELQTNLSNREMLDLYSETLVSLVPLSSGSGTRLKIIEGVMAGARILATPLGQEGLQGKMITTSSLEHFPSALIDLLAHLQREDLKSDFAAFQKAYDIDEFYHRHEEQLRRLLHIPLPIVR